MSIQSPLTAEHYWTADQLRVMRGLELPAWFSPVAHGVMPDSSKPDSSKPDSSKPESATSNHPVKIVDLTTLNLPALAEASNDCQACVLGQTSTACRKPLSVNPAAQSVQWLIVLDDNRNTIDVLTVDEHRLLGNMLASVGRSWESVEITPLLKCARSASATLDAYSDEVQACQPYLHQHIALLNPQLIIAMGELAAQALVGVDDGLDSLMGEAHEFEGLPMLVMPHPSDLLAKTSLKAQAWKILLSVER